MRRIILASGSPRRRELLAQTGLEFEVIPGEIDENAVVNRLREHRLREQPGIQKQQSAPASQSTQGQQKVAQCTQGRQKAAELPYMPETQNEQEVLYAASYPAEVVKALAFGKAEAVAEQIPEGIIIGSDTIVWDNEIMGKPEDRADAYRMLRQLQGRIHSVFTGVAVLVKDENDVKKHIFYSETKVEVYPMTETETKAYLDTGEPMDKAGAYGIQGKFGLWVKGIEGDYNSVVGLPLSALWQVLKEYV